MPPERKLLRRAVTTVAVALLALALAATALAAKPVKGGHYKGSSKPFNIGGNGVAFNVSKDAKQVKNFTAAVPFLPCEIGASNRGNIEIKAMKIKNGGFAGSAKTRSGALTLSVHGQFKPNRKASGSEKFRFSVRGFKSCSLSFTWSAAAQ